MNRPEIELESLRPLVSTSDIADEDLARGARLLGQVGPLARSEFRKRRVWNALRIGTRPPLLFRLRSWHLALAGVLVTAASSAAVGGLYVAHTQSLQRELADAPVPTPAKAPVQHARRAQHAAAPSVQSEPVAAAEPVADPAPAPHAPTRSRAADAAPHGKPAQSEAEAQLLVEAMRARREGDSQRVSELVDEYRAKHPNGSLQEEALILSVESAVSRHAPNASALAREYLSRFPSGRFAAQARRVASGGAR
jgi:hypothetical protein